MHPSTNFGRLKRTAGRHIARLRAQAVEATKFGTSPADRELAYVVLETQNLWSNFVRSYVISCLFRPRRCSGGVVTIGNAAVRTPGDIIQAAARAVKGPTAPAPTNRREEPAWHDVAVLLKTCGYMQCSHQAHIESALSIPTRAFQDLPVFRNFYAHRNEETAAKAIDLAARQYLIRGHTHPTPALATPSYRRPQPLVLDWLDDIRAVIELLCD